MSNDIKLEEALLKTRLNNERAERNRNIRLKNRENILEMYDNGYLTMEERNSMLKSFWCITEAEIREAVLEKNRRENPDLYPTPKKVDMQAPVKVYVKTNKKD